MSERDQLHLAAIQTLLRLAALQPLQPHLKAEVDFVLTALETKETPLKESLSRLQALKRAVQEASE